MGRPPVYVYEVLREWVTHAWLCDACRDRWRRDGWTIRSRQLPPPRELVVHPADGDLGERCDAALDDRAVLACQGCHLAALESCPTCGGPVVFPGSVGLYQCSDPAHVETSHAPTVQKLGTKSGGKKSRRATRNAP